MIFLVLSLLMKKKNENLTAVCNEIAGLREKYVTDVR